MLAQIEECLGLKQVDQRPLLVDLNYSPDFDLVPKFVVLAKIGLTLMQPGSFEDRPRKSVVEIHRQMRIV
jgi:hypothetical protein